MQRRSFQNATQCFWSLFGCDHLIHSDRVPCRCTRAVIHTGHSCTHGLLTLYISGLWQMRIAFSLSNQTRLLIAEYMLGFKLVSTVSTIDAMKVSCLNPQVSTGFCPPLRSVRLLENTIANCATGGDCRFSSCQSRSNKFIPPFRSAHAGTTFEFLSFD